MLFETFCGGRFPGFEARSDLEKCPGSGALSPSMEKAGPLPIEWIWRRLCGFCRNLPLVQMASQTEKNMFEIIMHLVADADADENYIGINFS